MTRRRIRTFLRRVVSMRTRPTSQEHGVKPRLLGALLRQHPGLWIAVKDDQVVLAAGTAYELIQELQQRRIRDATIVRAPDVGEAQTVGMG